ncbi:Multidrug efflux protein NorA [Pseudomonas sp. IT-P12]
MHRRDCGGGHAGGDPSRCRRYSRRGAADPGRVVAGLVDGPGGRAAVVEHRTGPAAVRPDREQRAGSRAIPADPAVRPARLPELHGPAWFHQRHWPANTGDGHQPGRHRGQLRAQLRIDHGHVRSAETGPGGHRPGHRDCCQSHGTGAGVAHSAAPGLRRLSIAPGAVTAQPPVSERDVAPGPADWRHLRGGGRAVRVRGAVHGHHGQYATGRAPDRAADRLGGIHDSGGAVLRDHHAHRPALRRRSTAGCTDVRTGRHRLRGRSDAGLRDGLLAVAEPVDRTVPGPQRPGLPPGDRIGGEPVGSRRLVRIVRRHANHRHGLHSRAQGRQDHVPGRPGLLLADWRARRLVDGVPFELGADGRLVGFGPGPGVRSGEPDTGIRVEDAADDPAGVVNTAFCNRPTGLKSIWGGASLLAPTFVL